MADGLKIKIGADVAQGVAGINQVNKSLAGLTPTAVRSAAGVQGLNTILTGTGTASEKAAQGAESVALGFSAASPIIGLAALAIIGWVRGIVEANEKARQTTVTLNEFAKAFGHAANSSLDIEQVKKALDEYQKIVEKVIETNGKEAATVETLVSRLQSGTISRKETVSVIKELQKIAPDYFGKLNKETASVNEVAAAYRNYNNELVKTVEAQIKLAELSDLVKDRLSFSRQHKEANDFVNQQLAAGKSLKEIAEAAATARDQEQKNIIKAALANKANIAEIEKQAILSSKIPFGVEGIVTALQKEKDLLEDIGNIPLKKLGIDFAPDPKIKEGFDSIRHAVILNQKELDQLQKQLDAINGNAPVKKAAFEGAPIGTGASGDIAAAGEAAAGVAETNKHLLKMQELTSQILSIVPLLGNAFTSVFEDIASGGKNALSLFAQAIGGVIKKLIAAAITAAIFAAIIGIATGGSGFAANASGVKSFGATVKALFGQLAGIPKFAKGGIVNGPTMALIGDNPSGKEAVIPFERMGEFINRVGGNGFIAETRISGDSLRILLRRSQTYFDRIH